MVFDGLEQIGLWTEHMALGVIVHCWDSGLRHHPSSEVPKQIAETKAIINVINKKDSQCFMWSILAALYPQHQQPQQNVKLCPPPK
ncbi:hypothetical protein TNCV_4159961 [Trichonephila clavipes]|nr:hypothetical protein TNCV_4159961 [Trichonephila clavipes]